MKKVETLIIGSGIAGAAIASKILEDNPRASILMLEAGPKVPMKDFALFQNYLITGQLPYTFCEDYAYPERHDESIGENSNIGGTVMPLQGGRLMTYGGSTVHWGGWSFRLKPEDFKLKTNTGKENAIDWPINYEELEPYYCESECYIGVSGDSNDKVVPRSEDFPYRQFPYTLEDGIVIKSMEKLGINYSHLPIARHGISDTESSHAPCKTTGTCKYCPFGARYVAGNYLDDMKEMGNYPNFIIKHGAVVDEILMSSKKKAKGVRYHLVNTTESIEVEAEKVIVAAGSVESAKLLLRSKTHWKNGIGNDNDLVGRNLITHPYFIFQADIPNNPEKLQPEMNFPTLVSRHFDSEAEQDKGKFIILNSPSSPLVKIGQAMQNGVSREGIDNSFDLPTAVQLHGIIEVFSERNNRVYNMENKINHLGLMETVVDYTEDPGFKDRMKEVKAIIDDIFKNMGAVKQKVTDHVNGKAVEREEYSKLIMLSWRADHAACLTRMAENDKDGVVDKNLKVFGVENLYVCSNSSFSSLGAINPTLTLGALSLRLGKHLVDLKNKK